MNERVNAPVARRKGPSFSSVPPGQGGGRKGPDGQGRTKGAEDSLRRGGEKLRFAVGSALIVAPWRERRGWSSPLGGRIGATRKYQSSGGVHLSRARDAYARTPTQSHAALLTTRRRRRRRCCWRRIVLPFPFHFPSPRRSLCLPLTLLSRRDKLRRCTFTSFFFPPLTVYTRACRATDRSH